MNRYRKPDSIESELNHESQIYAGIDSGRKYFGDFDKKSDDEKLHTIKTLREKIISKEINLSVEILIFLAHVSISNDNILKQAKIHECYENFKNPTEGLDNHQIDEILSILQDMERMGIEDKTIRYELSILLDFFAGILSEVQADDNPSNYGPQNLFGEYYGPSFLMSLCDFSSGRVFDSTYNGGQDVGQNSRYKVEGLGCHNYLINKKFQEIFEIRDGERVDKKDMLPGIDGGREDSFIYTIKNIDRSYQLRVKNNFYDGFNNVNPLFQIAPGYIGYYKNGIVSRVYRENETSISSLEERLISENKDEYDYIYDQLNGFHHEIKGQHTSNGLRLLEYIWDFAKTLETNGDIFIFDLSKINKEKMHPFVYAELLHRNNELLKNSYTGGGTEGLEEVNMEDFWWVVSPLEELSEEQKYQYLNLTHLSNRKKLEDELGINFGNFPVMIQRAFLTFIESKSISKMIEFKEKLSNINDKQSFFTTFLACSQDDMIGEKITELADIAGSEKLFKSYARLVSLQSEGGISDFLTIQLKRGKKLLLEAYEENSLIGDESWIEDFEELVTIGLKAKKLFKETKSTELTVDDFNEANIGFKVSIIQGGNLTVANNLLGSIQEENYPDKKNFSKEDFSRISDWIRQSLNDPNDPDLANVILEALLDDLQNLAANFIFLRNPKNELVGVCKIIENTEGTFYYGTHYLHPDFSSDFSLGTAIQVMLENKVSRGRALNATVKLDNENGIIRHIEHAGAVGTNVSQISSSSFLDFTIESEVVYSSKNKDLQIREDFITLGSSIEIGDYRCPLTDPQLDLLARGYVLTRIIRKDTLDASFMVFEKLQGAGELKQHLEAA